MAAAFDRAIAPAVRVARHIRPPFGRLSEPPPRAATRQDEGKPVAAGPKPCASPETHMSRIAAVIWALASRFKHVEDLQAAAALQIDAALYDIDRLRVDLEASIGLTLAVAGLLPTTHVAHLQPVTASGVPRPRRPRVTAGQATGAQSAA
jgi:hypothetical protein